MSKDDMLVSIKWLESVPVLLLLAVLAGITITLIVLSRSNKSKINLADLFLGDDRRMSRSAFVLMASFTVTTWGMVYMWLNARMTEGYFGAYLAAWVAPAVTKLIVNAGVAKVAAGAQMQASPQPEGQQGGAGGGGASPSSKQFRSDV